MKLRYFVYGLLATLVFVLLSVFIYASFAEFRYTLNRWDEKELYQMRDAGDIHGLNKFLENNKTVDGKMLAMVYIEKMKDPSSVPGLIKQLSYDHPWIDQEFSNAIFGERYYRATDVRRSAYQVLITFGDIQTDLEEHVESSDDIGKYYIAALQYVLGYGTLQEVERLAEGLKARHSVDIWFVMRDIGMRDIKMQ